MNVRPLWVWPHGSSSQPVLPDPPPPVLGLGVMVAGHSLGRKGHLALAMFTHNITDRVRAILLILTIRINDGIWIDGPGEKKIIIGLKDINSTKKDEVKRIRKH